MSMKLKVANLILILISLFFIIDFDTCLANETWKFRSTWESKQLIESPFFLITAADLNKNGLKEIIVADFGRFGDHIEEWKIWKKIPIPDYNLMIFEWDKAGLKLNWSRKWDMTRPKTPDEKDRYFQAYKARQIVSWQVGNKTIVETIPPYLGLEWINGEYLLHEQHGWKERLVGSWALPWLSPSCYQDFFWGAKSRECLAGIRDFSGKGEPKIVTLLEDEIIKDKQYKQTLRVRKFEPGFPIEWEFSLDSNKYYFGLSGNIDRLNASRSGMFLFHPLNLDDRLTSSWFILEIDSKSQGYQLKYIPTKEHMGIELYDLPDVYLRSTHKKGIEEFWGYHRKEFTDPESINFILLLKRVLLKPDLTGFLSEIIDFPHHKQFLGVGYFDLKDIDNDGLDEIILIEETGKVILLGEESGEYLDIKDYIRILKWDGKEYKTMWVSPPYTKRGTKFLVEDVKNTGKKQLVVMTPYGTIQIWERE